MLIDQLVKYLRDTLGVTVNLRQWEEGGRLPLFLRDGYVYYRARIHGLELLLVIDEDDEGRRPPSIVSKHLEQVRAKWGGEVVYVRRQVSAYNRKRLIEAGIQFIVPGNQLYLPMLAIDLREYFRRKRKNIHKFSPATQVLLFYWIYSEGGIAQKRATPTEMAKILGYTKMTMSRAYKEVDSVLDEVFAAGKADAAGKNYLRGRGLWDLLQPYWRNPVNRRHFLPKDDYVRDFAFRAGLPALAAYSMLAEPHQEVYAVDQNEWKVFLGQRQDVIILDQPDTQAVEVEIWSYHPHHFTEYGMKGMVDPLSLYLTLKESADERVEMALEKLLEGVRW